MHVGPHPSHVLRFSMDASTFDEICVNCGAHDEVPGGWGRLAEPCPNAPSEPPIQGNTEVTSMQREAALIPETNLDKNEK